MEQTTEAPRLDVASLYRAHGASVARWAARLGGPGVEVDDIVQEVFLVLERRLPTFRDEGGKITTWLFRATAKVVQTARRKQRVRRWLSRTPPDLVVHMGMGVSGLNPGEVLEQRQEIESIYAILDQLSECQRRVLILFEFEGLDTRAIADLIGVQPSTVRVRLHRARAKFVQRYEALWLKSRAGK